MGEWFNSLDKRLFISTRLYISRDLEKGVSKVLSFGLTFLPLKSLRTGKEENEANAEGFSKCLLGFAGQQCGCCNSHCFPITSPMPHNLPFLIQWWIPKLYVLDSPAQKVEGLRLTNASCAKGCKKTYPLLVQ